MSQENVETIRCMYERWLQEDASLFEAFDPDTHPLYRRIVHTAAPDLYFVGLIEAHRAILQIAEARAAGPQTY